MTRTALVVPGFPADEHDDCTPTLARWIGRRAADGESIDVYALQYPVRTDSWRVFGVSVRGFGRTGRGAGLRAVAPATDAIARAHRARPYDRIEAWWAEESGACAVAAGRLLKLPVQVCVAGVELATPADLPQRSAWRVAMARQVLLAADEVTVPTKWLLSRCPVPATVRPLPVDPQFTVSPPPARPPGGARFLVASALSEGKGVEHAIRAFQQVRQRIPRATLTIAGGGPLRKHLSGVVGEGDRSVTFVEAVRFVDMPALYDRHDVLVHASRWESQGLVIDEALARGLRVVATAVGRGADLPDAVRPGDVMGLQGAMLAAVGT